MSYGVVVIDDEYWIRSLICSFLPQEEGFVLLGEASDGVDGISLCRSVKPEILITDIKMPGMNGLELLEAVSREFPETQVIVISGYGEFEYAQRALKCGVLDYLLKPIDKKAVHDAVFLAAGRLDELRRGKQKLHKLEERMRHLKSLLHTGTDEHNIRDRRLEQAVVFIHENYSRDISLDEAASVAGMSPNYFSECFKKSIGSGFRDYVTAYRLQIAVKLLSDPSLKISEVSRLSGFRDPNYFSKLFKNFTGLNPSECRCSNLDFNALDEASRPLENAD